MTIEFRTDVLDTVKHGSWLADAGAVDKAVYAAIASTPTPTLDRAMARLSEAANYSRLSLAAAAILALTRGPEGGRAARLGLSAVGITATVVNVAIKPLSRRGRPDRSAVGVPAARQVPMPRSASLPSGHAAAAFAFATGVARVLPWDGAALQALAVLVGYSRVHTGVHYPGDVVLGAVAGIVLGGATANRLSRTAEMRIGRVSRSA